MQYVPSCKAILPLPLRMVRYRNSTLSVKPFVTWNDLKMLTNWKALTTWTHVDKHVLFRQNILLNTICEVIKQGLNGVMSVVSSIVNMANQMMKIYKSKFETWYIHTDRLVGLCCFLCKLGDIITKIEVFFYFQRSTMCMCRQHASCLGLCDGCKRATNKVIASVVKDKSN